MSLQVWLPLNGNLENKGLSDLTFAPVDANTTSTTGGKIASNCYYNDNGNTDSQKDGNLGGIISDKKLHIGDNLSMFAWINLTEFNTSVSLTGIGGMHTVNHTSPAAGDYCIRTGMGITIKRDSADADLATVSINTGANKNEYPGNNIPNDFSYHYYESVSKITTDKWYHIGFTCQKLNSIESKVCIYIDGKLDAERTIENQYNPDDYVHLFSWARDAASGGINVFNGYKPKGYINDFRIYDHALSKKEVKEIAKGLRLHYKLSSPRFANLTNGTGFNAYNNFRDVGVTDSIVALNETFMGYPVYRLTIVPVAEKLGSFQSELHSHGVYEGSHTYAANTPYCYWLYYRPVTNSDVRVGGVASNHHGWTEIAPHYFADGWYRVGQYRDGSVTSNIADGIYTSFRTPTAAAGVPISIDFCCPCLAAGTSSIIETYGIIDNESVEYDTSGYGNHGTISGTITADPNSPKYNHSYHIHGTSYISPGSINFVGTADSYTFSYWAKIPIGNMTGKMVWGISNPGSNKYLDVYPSDSRLHWNVGDSYSNPFYDVSTASYPYPNDGRWHHYAITGDGTENVLYIDGKYAAKSTTYQSIPESGVFALSGWDTGTNYKWSGGNISDFRLYATCLTASDISELYNVGASVAKDGTLFAHEFNEFNKSRKSAIQKDGVVSASSFSNNAIPTYDMKVKTLDDGSTWARIHYLDVTNSEEYFKDADEVAKCLDKHNRYSRMGDVDRYISQPYLPDGYTELEYIQSSGTQYIDTGFIPNNNTSIELDFEYLGTNTGTDVKNLFGARISTYEAVFAMWISTTNVYPHFGNVAYTDNGTFEINTSSRRVYKYNKNIASVDSATISCREAIFDSTYSLCLLTMQDSSGIDSRRAAGRIYSCKLYDGDRLVRDFVPCKNEANAIGLYDRVEDKFYANKGSGTFVAADFISKYEFMLTYPDMSTTEYNRWTQTSSPNEAEVKNYVPIHVDWPRHCYGLRQHGEHCIYNCDSGGTWFAPIGQLGHGNWNGAGSKIPFANADNISAASTELWVRVDHFPKANQMKIYDGSIVAANFIEI